MANAVPRSNNGNGNNKRKNWSADVSFARWVDGTSNQIIWGEKHIPSKILGKCGYSGLSLLPMNDDCTYIQTGGDGGRGSLFRVIQCGYTAAD